MADTRQYPNPGDKELPEVNADDEGKVLAVVKGAWDKAGSQIELPVVTSEDNGKLLGVTGGKWDSVNAPTELPAVTNEDNGRILQVSSGAWTKQNMPTELPAVTATDNGKVLGVADGNWGVVNAPSGGGEVFVINGIIDSVSGNSLSAGGSGTIDKTWSQINDAVHAGKIIMLHLDYSGSSVYNSILGGFMNDYQYSVSKIRDGIYGVGEVVFSLMYVYPDSSVTFGEFTIYGGGDPLEVYINAVKYEIPT